MPTPPLNDGIATGQSFEERVGAPDPFTSALGHLVLAFSELERSAIRPLGLLLGVAPATAEVIGCELSFQKKVHLLAALVRLNPREISFQTSGRDPVEVFAGIVTECFRAEELRNTVLHSSWEVVPHEPDRRLRFKWSAKAKQGLHTRVDVPDAAAILDVAEYVDRASTSLDLFFMRPPVVVA